MSQLDLSREHSIEVLNNAELLYDTETIDKAIYTMSESITSELHDTNPLVMPIMIGGLVLAGKLMPLLNFPLQIDYVHATRYRGQTSGQELHWKKKPDKPVLDRTILLIDDILDEGITLAAIIDFCHKEGAQKVYTAVLAEKKLEQEKPIEHADFSALEVPDRYVFGYGMDYHEYHRNQSGIYAVNE